MKKTIENETKVTLEFNLEDEFDLDTYVVMKRAEGLRGVINELQSHLRSKRKYENISEDEEKFVEDISQVLWKAIEDNKVDDVI